MDALDQSGEILQKIGQRIVASVPTEWEKVWVEADLSSPGVVSAQYFYLKPGEEKPISYLGAGGAVNILFIQLRNIVKKGDDCWKKVLFEVTKDGKFNTEFEY